MERLDAEALENLRWNWEGAYTVDRPELGLWIARRLDDGSELRADNPEALRDVIRADYERRPVPR